MAKTKKIKFLSITDRKTNRNYAYPKRKGYEDLKKKFSTRYGAALEDVVYSPLTDKWYAVTSANGIVDDQLIAFKKHIHIIMIY